MFLERVCLIAILATATARRISRSSVPSWYLPCGEELDLEATSSESPEEELKISNKLLVQHWVTLHDFLNRDYEFLYRSVNIGIHDYQYIPTWVPNKEDVNHIERLKNADSETIASHLPKLHTDLQKFAVAFEKLVEDETNLQMQQALQTTQGYLMRLLCEVETNILSLPHLKLPMRIERTIMTKIERNPDDVTRRLVRDWGVLLRYRDYLHAWRHVFKY